MTVDFVQRKSAKKGWKKKAKLDNNGETRTIRERKRRGKRRLCKGMCYKDPSSQITLEDKNWVGDDENSEGEGDEEGDGVEMADRRAMHQQASPSNNVIKLSTYISLIQPKANDGKKAARGTTGAKVLGGLAAAAAGIPAPLSPFHPVIAQCMIALGHQEPTPIQEQVWPAICEGKDVLGVAQPGSGKTLGYLLPALVRFTKQGSTQPAPLEEGDVVFGPKILILVPTRELAIQVASQARQLRSLSGLSTACLYGGVPKETQVELLQRNPEIVVATCGRLLDLIDDNLLSLSPVEYLVLDEADKMLGLGFKAQLDRLQVMLLDPPEEAIPSKPPAKNKGEKAADKSKSSGSRRRPQVLLFTATMPQSVDEAARQWLHQPVSVSVSHSADSISRTITQCVQVCADHKKPAKLLKHLQSIKESGANLRNPQRVLVFCNQIKTVRFLHDLVSKEGHRCAMLHGQRSQPEREEAITSFKAGKVQVLFATDVAARGLDIRRLPYVVSFDFPLNLDTYIHRVGRTGRLESTGHSFSFFTRNLAKIAGPLMTLLRDHNQSIDPNLQQLAVAWEEAVEKAGGMHLLEHRGEGEEEGEGIEDRVVSIEAADIDEGLQGVVVKKEPAERQKMKIAVAKKVTAKCPQPSAPAPAPAPAPMEEFISSSKFAGSKQGYMFKTGLEGLGYYKDVQIKKSSLQKPSEKHNRTQVNRTAPIIAGGGKKRMNWDEDDEDDFVSKLGGTSSKGRKSIPGRLRKKLKK